MENSILGFRIFQEYHDQSVFETPFRHAPSTMMERPRIQWIQVPAKKNQYRGEGYLRKALPDCM